MNICFSENAWNEYREWCDRDRKIAEKIHSLIKDASRNPFSGLGKPEPLKHRYAGHWSRRISDEHRLVYKVEGKTLYIIQCRYHY